jgi:hypothetical protein
VAIFFPNFNSDPQIWVRVSDILTSPK